MTTGTESGASRRRRILDTIGWIGLGVSIASLMAALPRLVHHGGGPARLFGNTAAVLWTLLLLLLVVAHVRTVGARAIAGAWFAGFFGVLSLSTLIGRPVVAHFGADSTFAVALFAPFTEELLKLLPVALFLLIAARNRAARPSVGDALLYGATIGGGFAVYENALYARGFGGWSGTPPLSLLLPTLQKGTDGAFVGGHVVFTAVAALGLAVTVAYRRRFRLAALAAPVAFLEVFAEHAQANQLDLSAGTGRTPWWVDITRIVTLDGYLSTLLLIAGAVFVAVVERRLASGHVPQAPSRIAAYVQSLRPSRALVANRAAALAAAQCGPVSVGVTS